MCIWQAFGYPFISLGASGRQVKLSAGEGGETGRRMDSSGREIFVCGGDDNSVSCILGGWAI